MYVGLFELGRVPWADRGRKLTARPSCEQSILDARYGSLTTGSCESRASLFFVDIWCRRVCCKHLGVGAGMRGSQ